jgi:DNA-binding transcriptional MerR regulator
MGAERAFLSIGDVLALLKDDFPDVTISKIRFLESQGLLDPERTPSGYRKFYEADVERLRWILRQQREHFLPLKVIKDRLSGAVNEAAGEQGRFQLEDGGEDEESRPRPPSPAPVGVGARAAAPSSARTASNPSLTGARRESHAGGGSSTVGTPRLEDAGERLSREQGGPSISTGTPGSLDVTKGKQSDEVDALRQAREALGLAAPRSGGMPVAARRALGLEAAPSVSRPEPEAEGDEGVSLTIADLAAAAGLPLEEVENLARYGLITGRQVAGTVYFDEDALAVARLAAGFFRFGIEARHIRSYRLAAEREVGLFEQVIVPILRQKNPEARKLARQTLGELSKLGQQMRTAMVRAALKGLDRP